MNSEEIKEEIRKERQYIDFYTRLNKKGSSSFDQNQLEAAKNKLIKLNKL